MRIFIALFYFILCVPGVLLAQSGKAPVYDTKWTVALSSEDQKLVNCLSKNGKSKTYCTKLSDAEKVRAKALKTQTKWIESEVAKIVKWMGKTQKYPTGDFSRLGNHGEIIFKPDEWMTQSSKSKRKPIKDAPIEKSTDIIVANFSSWNGMININEDFFLFDKFDKQYASETLAHELFHSVQAGQIEFKRAPKWVSEGLAEAVGYAWTASTRLKNNPKKMAELLVKLYPSYSTSLESPEDPYERGHFFYYLGLHFGDNMKYAGNIIATKMSTNGIAWLENYLKFKSKIRLEDYYPKFLSKLMTEFYLPGPPHYGDIEAFSSLFGGCTEVDVSSQNKKKTIPFERVSAFCFSIKPPRSKPPQVSGSISVGIDIGSIQSIHRMQMLAKKGTQYGQASLGLVGGAPVYGSWTYDVDINGASEIYILSHVDTDAEETPYELTDHGIPTSKTSYSPPKIGVQISAGKVVVEYKSRLP